MNCLKENTWLQWLVHSTLRKKKAIISEARVNRFISMAENEENLVKLTTEFRENFWNWAQYKVRLRHIPQINIWITLISFDIATKGVSNFCSK